MSHRNKSGDQRACILILIWLATVLGLSVANAHAGEAVRHGPGTGELELICSSESFAVPAVETEVDLDVTGPLIHAIVRQVFTNPADEVVSARYVLPLPEGAAVSAMELQIGERRIISIVKEKEAARAVYEQARKEGRKAALVSSARRNLFVTEVANVGPGATVSVRLEYLDQVDYEDGWFSLVHPLTFTPRFFPATNNETGGPVVPLSAADAFLLAAPFVGAGHPAFPQVDIDVHLTAGLELADILCPSHEANFLQEDDTWWIAPAAGEMPADRDFILRWRPVQDPLARPLLFSEEGPEDIYALLMVVPGDPAANTERPPTDTVFVLDVSGSMGGPSIAQARRALAATIGKLRSSDRFTVLAFDDGTYPWSRELRPVDPSTLASARKWVRRREARGGTMMLPALLQARLMCGDGSQTGRARQIILLTDAAVGNEDQLLREIVASMKDVRLHVVGIGPAPNRHLVRRLAGEGGGQSLFVAGIDGDTERLSAFLTRIGRPQWSDPRLDWHRTSEVEGYPSRLPAPVSGQLILWSGRFPAGADVMGVLRADGAAGDLQLPLRAVMAPAGSGLAARWARLRVDDLLAAHDANMGQAVEREELHDAVVATALEHGLVTRFTSRVAVELVPTTDRSGPTRDIASGLPKGSQLPGQLPAGGTLDGLLRLVGLALLLTGSSLFVVHHRRLSK